MTKVISTDRGASTYDSLHGGTMQHQSTGQPHYRRRPRKMRPRWLRSNRKAVQHTVPHFAQPLKPKNVIAR